jgi:glycosidase
MSRLSAAALLSIGLAASSLMLSRGGPVTAAADSKTPNLQLYADGWDTAYHSPFGAVPTDSKLTLSLTSATIVTKATVYFQTGTRAASTFAMHVAHRSTGTKTWSTDITMPAKDQILTYYFRAQAGRAVRWYGDNSNALDGGPGQAYVNEGDVLAYYQTVFLKSFQTPNWMTKAVIYQIFPDRFFDGNKSNDSYEKTGTVRGYIDDYFHKNWSGTPFDGPPCPWPQCYSSDFFGGDLEGIVKKLPYLQKLGINVIYLNPIFEAPSDHKYDTSNFLKIDPGFGSQNTFKTLVADAKRDGIHLILDGVFEDTGSDSVYFNEFGSYPSVGAYQSQTSQYYPWYTFYNWPSSYNDFAGYTTLPMLNENQSVENFIFRKPSSVAQYWLRQGASGWRLDSADRLDQGYWTAFRTTVKVAFPQSVIIAEPQNWTADMVSWLMGDMWDGVMNYRFRESALDFFAQGRGANNPTSITAAEFLDGEMGLLAEYPRPAILSSMNLVDSHDTMRVLTSLQGNKQALRLVAMYQMTWLGAPTILYGDESGIQGIDANVARATFPWRHQDSSLESYYSELIHMRLKYPALTMGSVQPLLASNRQRVVAYLRKNGNQRIVVALNDSTQAQTFRVPVPQIANGTQLTSILGGSKTKLTVRNGQLTITLPKLAGSVLLASAA